jgi:predicted phage baseplate assembly protein
MPLPLPNLDDRCWSDLVEEGQALIPRYAPKWTDHNVHDPGITLIELFAWLTEANIYRLNRVSERHRRKFLSFIGFDPAPLRAAKAMVSFSPTLGAQPVLLPAGTELEVVTDSQGETIPLRTLRALRVQDVQLQAVHVDAGDGYVRDLTRDWREGLPIGPLGKSPTPNAALYLGFASLPAGESVALALRFQGTETGAEARACLRREAAEQRSVSRLVLPGGYAPQQAAAEVVQRTPAHHSVELVWEVYRNGAWLALRSAEANTAPKSGEVWDDTRALTLDGIVEVNLPTGCTETTPTEPGGKPLFYLRCRLLQGEYDAAPSMLGVQSNAVVAEQAVPALQTFTISPAANVGGTVPAGGASRLHMRLASDGSISDLRTVSSPAADAVPLVTVLNYKASTNNSTGSITLELIRVGTGNGRPDQRLVLSDAPVDPESLRLFTHDGSTWHEWERRKDFDASERSNRHYLLEQMSGEILFGDGEQGRPPPARVAILASYRVTRAGAAKLVVGSRCRVADTPRNRSLPPAARAIPALCTPYARGSDLETLAQATGRAVAIQHAHQGLLDFCAQTHSQSLDQNPPELVRALTVPSRALNLLDIERLALAVPGTRVARARAWAGHHAAYPCLDVPGVVTVVVLPEMAVARPTPSLGLRRAVQRFLNRRRLICMRIQVAGPEYLAVHVSACVRAVVHADTARVRKAVIKALSEFLDPRIGGPNGLGWPFGRDLYRSEVMQLIDGVPGVDHVLELSLRAGEGEAQCGNIRLCPTWLVASGEHRIQVKRGE